VLLLRTSLKIGGQSVAIRVHPENSTHQIMWLWTARDCQYSMMYANWCIQNSRCGGGTHIGDETTGRRREEQDHCESGTKSSVKRRLAAVPAWMVTTNGDERFNRESVFFSTHRVLDKAKTKWLRCPFKWRARFAWYSGNSSAQETKIWAFSFYSFPFNLGCVSCSPLLSSVFPWAISILDLILGTGQFSVQWELT
jgi:hypothetical protein